MSESISLKEALKFWETKHKKKASEETEIKLCGNYPPIDKLDSSASVLTKCEKISLSTNVIEKISNLGGLKNLRILSLGRNKIKSLSGVEAVSETLEELWLSHNGIERLKAIEALKKLKVLLMSNNQVNGWKEVLRLSELPLIENVLLAGNPIEEQLSQSGEWRNKMASALPTLKVLDSKAVIRQEEEGSEN